MFSKPMTHGGIHSPLPSESPAKVGGQSGQNNLTRIPGGNPASRDAWKHIRLIHAKKKAGNTAVSGSAPSPREDGPKMPGMGSAPMSGGGGGIPSGGGSPLMHMRGPHMSVKAPKVVG